MESISREPLTSYQGVTIFSYTISNQIKDSDQKALPFTFFLSDLSRIHAKMWLFLKCMLFNQLLTHFQEKFVKLMMQLRTLFNKR